MSQRLKIGKVIAKVRQRELQLFLKESRKRAESGRLHALYDSAHHRNFMSQQTGVYNQLAAFSGSHEVAPSLTQNPLEKLGSHSAAAILNTEVQGTPQQLGAAENQETPRKGVLARLAAWLRVRRLALKGPLS